MKTECREEAFPTRTANLGSLCIISASQTACVQLGDRGQTTASLQALSLQRQQDHTSAGDVFFESYPIFNRAPPILNDAEYDNGQVVNLERVNLSPNICVGSVHIIAAGAASSIQAGNGMRLTTYSRIKHIRQYPRPRPVPPVGYS
ncbi:spore germination protein GerPE [Paenibacillus sp. sgz302251]|uniref:spore germination protein GerPE n=1 Tax=Paenibacillus sp. sgz302251 TaxID=3414493 RepID=UPI003C7A6D77